MHIDNATSVKNHVRRAVRAEFYISKETPIRGEVDESIRFTRDATYTKAKSFSPAQRERVKQYVSEEQCPWHLGR